MSDAEEAYRGALEEIDQVKAAGRKLISLGTNRFRALDRIPPEVAGIEGLESVDLYETQVSDPSPLAAISSLRELELEQTPVTDLSSLTALSGLESLNLDSTSVSDLTPLSALSGLRVLELSHTRISDLSPLATLPKLQKLFVNHTQVSDLGPLAALSGLEWLFLAQTQVSDLGPLAALSRLQMLWLDQTSVSDLGPLARLTGLQDLTLSRTQVADLRPLLGLERLGTDGREGLTFTDTPATARDATLARLAGIKDRETRARETHAYLRSLPPWPEPYTPAATPDGTPPRPIGAPPEPPEQDPALPLVWGENGFAFFAESIDSDPVTEAALGDLRALLDDLRRKGNRHDDLYRIAGELQQRSAGPIPELNMVKLHLSFQKLRRLHAGRAARQEAFDDETVTTMAAVLDVLPGVTLADDGVRVLIERQEAERARGLSEAQAKAAERVLNDVQKPDAPFAPEVKDVAAEALAPGGDDRLTATRGILSHNVLIATLNLVGIWVAEGAIGGPVGNFVYEHGTDLLAYAATMGDDAFLWAQSVMARFRVEYELAMGIARELSGSPRPPRRKHPRRGGGV